MAANRRYDLSDLDKMGIMKSVNLLLFYELLPTADIDTLLSSWKEGVKNATCQLPFMAGHLKFDDTGKPYIEASPDVELEILTRQFDSVTHLIFSNLAKDSFCPNDADFAQYLPTELAEKKRVCRMQLNVIEGGLILGLRVNHAVGDWTSIDTFLSLVCQSTKAYNEGREMPTYHPDLNRASYNTPEPGLATSRQEHLERLPMFYVMEKSQFKPPQPPPPSRSSIYRVSAEVVQQLKAECTPHLKDVEYISSYDCISALLWRALTRARLQINPEKKASPSRFVHPIDVRRRDPEGKTSERYFGNAVIGTQAGPMAAEELVSHGDCSLAAVATLIRKSVQSVDLSTISHMTSLIASLDATQTLGSRTDFTDMDMFMNSWYSPSGEKYGIGNSAVPVALRPADTMPGACMVMLPSFSRERMKDFEILVHTAVEESEVLRRDAEFNKYFKLVSQ